MMFGNLNVAMNWRLGYINFVFNIQNMMIDF